MQIAQAAHLDPGDLSRVDLDDLELRFRWAVLCDEQYGAVKVRQAILTEMAKREIRRQTGAA